MSFGKNVVVVGTSYQILGVESFWDWERAKPSPIKITALTFQVKNSTITEACRIAYFSRICEKALS